MTIDELIRELNYMKTQGSSSSTPVVVLDTDTTTILTITSVTLENHEDGIGSTIWLKAEEH